MDARRERRQLRNIERALGVADPEWLRSVGGRPGVTVRANCMPVRVFVDTMAVLSVALGAATALFPLIFLGCLLLVTGACMHTTHATRAGTEDHA
ncbi:DUF3040 domain-containing protein [Actinocrispum sp. NPDC049592]|uniref:DUF3040 domain-containing protein n=1 Tax=Actinocrispum sp. NPDC049592 TaxID=3154835 RepID=UPI00343FE705